MKQVIEEKWDRPLEGNHIVNVPPDQQKSWPTGKQFILGGIEMGLPNDGFTANAWFTVTSDYGPTAGNSIDTAKFNVFGKATGNRGMDFPKIPLYGVIGTNEEGWVYYPGDKKWRKTVDVPDVPGTGTTGTTGPTLPPGPTQGGAPTQKVSQAIEFSISEDGDGFWVAKTPASSAANKDGNPHPGISIINPGEWDRVTGGMSTREALSLDQYKEEGWTGIDRHILAWQGTDSQPAGEEISSAIEAAKQGDTGALRALRAVGINPPPAGRFETTGGFLDKLFS